MKPPTDDKIREAVYSQTFQETSKSIEAYINGMIDMRDIWLKAIKDEQSTTDRN